MIITMKKNVILVVIAMGFACSVSCYAGDFDKRAGILTAWSGMSPITGVMWGLAETRNWSDQRKAARVARYARIANAITVIPSTSILVTIGLFVMIDQDNPYKDAICKAASFPYEAAVNKPADMWQRLEDKFNRPKN